MFVLFLSFVFLSITVKCAEMYRPEVGKPLASKLTSAFVLTPITTVSENTAGVKTQLRKSLSHVKTVLADIEGKIEKERKLLAQIDYNLDYNGDPGFLDYNVTDIWWPSVPTLVGQHYNTLPATVKERVRPTPRSSNLNPVDQQINRIRNTNNTKSVLRDVPTIKISDIVAQWVRSVTNTTSKQIDNENRVSVVFTDLTTPITVATIITTVSTTTTAPMTTTALPVSIAGEITNEIVQRTLATPQGVQHTLPPGVPPGWPFPTSGPATTENPFIEDLRADMVQDQQGYFSAFLTKYLEVFSEKDVKVVPSILDAIEIAISKMMYERKLDSLGQTHQGTVLLLLGYTKTMTPFLLQQQAGVVHHIMKNKKTLTAPLANRCFDLIDSLITRREGELLFATLDDFDLFPEGGKSAQEVCTAMLEAIMAPMQRMAGTRDHRKLISALNEAIQEEFPNWRTHSKENNDITNTEIRKPNNISADNALQHGQISRRSIGSYSYKKILRHILLKHPKLYKRFHRHLKHRKKNKHHHQGHNKRHHVSHKRHKKHGHHISPLVPVVKPKQEFKKIVRMKAASSPELGDSGGSGAFYREPEDQVVTQTIKKRIKTKTKKSKKKRSNDRKHKKVNKKPIHPKLPIYPNNLKEKYIKLLKKKLGITEKNRKSFRRIMMESSETEVDKDSFESGNTSAMNVFNRIRETSSYSDEEEYIRTNLYDALRHGNRSFVQFRALDDDKNNNTFSDISSGPDDEWVLKNNIYKVFQQ